MLVFFCSSVEVFCERSEDCRAAVAEGAFDLETIFVGNVMQCNDSCQHKYGDSLEGSLYDNVNDMFPVL